MTDIQLDGQSITCTSTSGTTSPSAGTSETWSVSALASGIPTLNSTSSYALVDAVGTISEIIRVTAATAGATSITVTRGADSSTVSAHGTGATYNIVAVASYFAAISPSVEPIIRQLLR